MNAIPSGTTEFQGRRPSVNGSACSLPNSKVTVICSSLIKFAEAFELYNPI